MRCIICHSDQGRIVHLHVTLGTADGQVIGGHLVDGEIYTTVELVPAVGLRQSGWAASPAFGFQTRCEFALDFRMRSAY